MTTPTTPPLCPQCHGGRIVYVQSEVGSDYLAFPCPRCGDTPAAPDATRESVQAVINASYADICGALGWAFERGKPVDVRDLTRGLAELIRQFVERDTLRARIVELEAALAPFAEYGAATPAVCRDTDHTSAYTWFSSTGTPPNPTVGDCRKAAALLANPEAS